MKFTFKHTKYACYFAYISTAITNNIGSLLFFTFYKQFGISEHLLALLVTINFATQVAVDLLGAKYADRIGYRPLLYVAFSSCILGLLSMGLLPSVLPIPYIGLCISSVLFAIGGGLGEVLISPLIEALPGDEKASAMSILHSFYCWGVVLVVALSAVFFKFIGTVKWQLLPLLWAIVPLSTLILFTRVPIRTLSDDAPTLTVKRLFGNCKFWFFALLMLCGGAAELVVAQWSSMLAESALGVSKATGDLLGPCFFSVCMGVIRAIYGKLGDKLPLVPALFISAIISLTGYIVIFAVENSYLALAGCGLVGIGVALFWPGILSYASRKIPSGGTAMFALLAVFGDLGCAIAPEATAIVASIGENDLRDGIFAGAIFPLVIAASTLFLILKKNTAKNTAK